MIVKLLTEHHLEFLSLKGGCRGSSVSTLVKLLEISCHGSFDSFVSKHAKLRTFQMSLVSETTLAAFVLGIVCPWVNSMPWAIF